MSKFLDFFSFNLKMSTKDPVAQWRTDTVMRNLPLLKDLKCMLKEEKLTREGDKVIFKLLLDVHSAYLSKNEDAPFKQSLSYLLPLSKKYYRTLSSSVLEKVTEILKSNFQSPSWLNLQSSRKEYLRDLEEQKLRLKNWQSE